MANGVVVNTTFVELRFGIVSAPVFNVINATLRCMNTTLKALSSDMAANRQPVGNDTGMVTVAGNLFISASDFAAAVNQSLRLKLDVPIAFVGKGILCEFSRRRPLQTKGTIAGTSDVRQQATDNRCLQLTDRD
jgi:hypothetical protein